MVKGNQSENGKGRRTGKVEIRRIQNPMRRQITFSKRKAGLFKKADELSLLCEVDIAVIISSPSGKLYHSPAPNIGRVLGRYQKFCAASDFSTQAYENIELSFLNLENARKQKMNLEVTQRHMKGEDLSSLSYKELDHLEHKLEIGANKIHSRKEKLFKQYIRSSRKELGRDQNDEEGGTMNATVDVTADYQQPERHDGDSENVSKSETDLDLRLY